MKDRSHKATEQREDKGNHGTWDYDPYFHGMFNGMALIIAVMEDKEPEYKDAPEQWVKDKRALAEPIETKGELNG